ncbi:unnamed protein product [Larinioides sclopetarius]|uniref:Uncharacterized protein n=1 Tax=Larinioides sclopetarius TaxID=280406 RepID=A0AAV1YZS5_9ARAC
MMGKTISPVTMYFAVVLVILFRISFGFPLYFGLDKIFHDLIGGKAELFNFGNFKESKSLKSNENRQADKAHDSSFSTNSPLSENSKIHTDLNSSILKDNITSLDTTIEKSGAALNEGIEVVTVQTGMEEHILEDSLVRSGQKSSDVLNGRNLEGLLKTVSGKENETTNGSNSRHSLETLTKTVGRASHDNNVEDILGTMIGKEAKSENGSIMISSLKKTAEKAGKAVSGRILEDSLQTIVENAGGPVGVNMMEDTLRTASRNKNKALSNSPSKGSLENVAGNVGGVLDERNLEDSLKTTSEKIGKAVSDIASKVSLETLSGTASGAESRTAMASSLENAGKKIGGVVHDSILEDSLKIASGKASGEVGGIASKVPLESVSGKTGEAISSSAVESSLGYSLANVAKQVGDSVQDSNLEDSLKTASGEAGGEVRGIASKVSLENVSGKTGGAISSSAVERSLGGSLENAAKKVSGLVHDSNLEDSLKTASGKAGGSVGGIISKVSSVRSGAQKSSLGTVTSKDFLEIVSDDDGGTLESSLSSVSGGNEGVEGGLNDEIQTVTGTSRNQIAINPLQTVITDVTVGEQCTPKSDATSFSSVPAVSKFVRIFNHGVHSSELLTILFNVTDATPLQFSLFKYRYIVDAFRRLGLIEANDIAAFAVRHIANHFETLIPKVLERVYANAFANYFFAEGFLTHDNAEQLALEYLKAMEESTEINGVSSNCDYNRNFQALGDGFFTILLSVGELSSPQAWETAFYYAHEWLLAAVDYGPL